MKNEYRLDVDYFTKLCAREFNPDMIRRQPPQDLASALARAARAACAGVLREEAFEWERLYAPGQIVAGDEMHFHFNGKSTTAHVAEVLNPGSDREEVVYNRRKNFYFVTSMAIEGSSHAKQERIRIRPLQPE